MKRAEMTDRLLYLRMSEDGQHIRKWAREPFDGATAYANAGNGAPLGPYDRSDHYSPEELPFALQSIAENIHVECAPHVLEDMVRIVTDSARELSNALAKQEITRDRIGAALDRLKPGMLHSEAVDVVLSALTI